AFALSFRECADRRVEQRAEIEALHDLFSAIESAAEESEREIERPAHRLRGPGRDRVRQIKEDCGALARCQRAVVPAEGTGIERQHAAEAFEQGGLAGAIRSDEAEHFAPAYRKGHVAQRGDRSISLGETRRAYDAIG